MKKLMLTLSKFESVEIALFELFIRNIFLFILLLSTVG